jgi:hypothetical protein
VAEEAGGSFLELMLRPVLRVHDIRGVATAAWDLNVYIMSYGCFCQCSAYEGWDGSAVTLQYRRQRNDASLPYIRAKQKIIQCKQTKQRSSYLHVHKRNFDGVFGNS